MVAAGYMAKRVAERPDWLGAERVSSIYSVSGCVSHNFTDYPKLWKHNGYWLFDAPDTILAIAREQGVDASGTQLFFYEVHDHQFDGGVWAAFAPDPSFGTDVSIPEEKAFEGFDVISFAAQTSPECSPLSCNLLATEVETNARCLLSSFDEARTLLENGTFSNAEPGPYRIFAVYSVAWPGAA